MGSPSVTATTTPGPNTGVSPLSTETVSVDPLTGLFSPAAAAGIVTSNPTTGAISGGGKPVFRPLVAKIKAAMAGAAGNNRVELAPLIAAPQWVTGTAYGASAVVLNAGNDYVNVTGAATSGATAPTGTGPAVVSDGTIAWLYLGAHKAAATAYDTPVVTYSATYTGITRLISSVGSGNSVLPSFLYTGGFGYYGGGNGNGINVAGVFCTSGGNQAGLGGTYGTAAYSSAYAVFDFMTDAPKIGLTVNYNLFNGDPIHVIVNNRSVQSTGLVSGTTVSAGSTILDFTGSSALGRAERRIRIRTNGPQVFFGVQVDTLSSVWQPANPNRYRIYIEGDSLIAGAFGAGFNVGPCYPGGNWPEQFADLIGCDDVIVGGIGGTGFINAGTNNTYAQRIPFAASLNPDVVMVCGCYNDTSNSASTIQAAVLAYLQALRAALPNALILVFGPWPGTQSGVTTSTWPAPPAANATTTVTGDAAMKAAVLQFNDLGTFFYSAINDANGSWLYGTGYTASQTGNGNSDLYTAQGGHPHPSQQGMDYEAVRYVQAFKSLINAIN